MTNRQYSIKLIENTGNGTMGSSIDLTKKIRSIGKLEWAVDNQLAKCLPGSCSFSINDRDGSLWAWKSNLSGTLPPFCIITVDSNVNFVGVINYTDFTKNVSNNSVNITASDWSSMLKNVVLNTDDWKRQDSVYFSNSSGSIIKHTGISSDVRAIVNNVYSSLVTFDPMPTDWTIINGNQMSVDGQSGIFIVQNTKVDNIWNGTSVRKVLTVDLKGFDWNDWFSVATPVGSRMTMTFDKIPDSLVQTPCILTTADVIPSNDANAQKIYSIPVNTTDSIAIGDSLETRLVGASNSYKITDIDSENSLIYVDQAISNTIQTGTGLYLSDDTINDLVFVTAKDLINKAAIGFDVDWSGYAPGVLASPYFHWVGFRASNETGGNTLRSPWDCQPGLSTLQVKGLGGKCWEGDSGTSYAAMGTAYTKGVIWTGQLTTAPSSLMPDETDTLAPYSRRRNRSYITWQYQDQDNSSYGGPSWDPTKGKGTACVVAHDYSGMRRLVYTSNSNSLSYATWSGSAWSSSTNVSYPLAKKPISIVPMPGTTSSLGSGSGFLVLDAANNLNIILSTVTVTACSVDSKIQNSVLVNTRNGVYLISKNGYGLVSISNGQLQLKYSTIGPDVFWQGNDFSFMPNTLATVDSSSVWIMAVLSVMDYDSGTEKYETHLYKLASDPSTLTSDTSPILMDELVISSVPRISLAFTHPSGNKIFGMIGGQLFEISSKVPDVIQRITPGGSNAMSAIDLIQYVCESQNAMAVADLKSGLLKIITRKEDQQPTNITVKKRESSITAVSEDCYSMVVVTGSDVDKYHGYAYGQPGRDCLTLDSVPILWSLSHCQALAESYANFFCKFREMKTETWGHNDPTSAPVWESLQPFQKIQINNDTKSYYLMSLSRDLDGNTANVKLLEAVS
jgi:hypothetical protein